jgi:hypothetical protein
MTRNSNGIESHCFLASDLLSEACEAPIHCGDTSVLLCTVRADEPIHLWADFDCPNVGFTRALTLSGNSLMYWFSFTGFDNVNGTVGFADETGVGIFLFERCNSSSSRSNAQCVIQGSLSLSDAQIADMLDGGWYLTASAISFRNPLTFCRVRAELHQVPDSDLDGVPDYLDHCAGTGFGAVVDENGCSIEQLCPCAGSWKNHGAYLKSLRTVTGEFRL